MASTKTVVQVFDDIVEEAKKSYPELDTGKAIEQIASMLSEKDAEKFVIGYNAYIIYTSNLFPIEISNKNKEFLLGIYNGIKARQGGKTGAFDPAEENARALNLQKMQEGLAKINEVCPNLEQAALEELEKNIREVIATEESCEGMEDIKNQYTLFQTLIENAKKEEKKAKTAIATNKAKQAFEDAKKDAKAEIKKAVDEKVAKAGLFKKRKMKKKCAAFLPDAYALVDNVKKVEGIQATVDQAKERLLAL